MTLRPLFGPVSLLSLLLAAVVGPAGAQAPEAAAGSRDPDSLYVRALTHLEAGDTTAAIVGLRGVVRADPRHGPAHLRLGALLSARASEAEREFGERSEAEKALERAFELMGDDPEVLLEYGLLLLKKQMRTDARRVLERAWRAAERRGAELPPAERARFHYTLGRIYETWWEDWQGLVMIPPTAASVTCSRITQDTTQPLPHAQVSVLCPERWAEQSEHVVPLADLKSDEHERMVGHFQAALEADPGHVDAAVRLLGHLADAEAWDRYGEVASVVLAAAPNEPRAHLFLGLGLHERGRDEAADSAFRRALELMPERERRVFDDVSVLLPPSTRAEYQGLDAEGREDLARFLLTAKDPLFLTGTNERRLEHYARLAWAELKFSAPGSGLRGWDSERGVIWVRYGRPWRSYQCCYGAGPSHGSGAFQRSRNVYWSYGPEGPLFTFERNLTYRKATLTPAAKQVADDLATRAPELYRPRTVTVVHDLPHQMARFRGEEEGVTRIEVYALPPLDSLGVAPGAAIQAGVFAFLEDFRPVWERRHTSPVSGEQIGLTYRFQLPSGRYRYALEARLAGPDSLARPVARAREHLETLSFPEGRLSVSDLLLAALIQPRVPSPRTRDELVIAPLRTTEVEAGQPIRLYFEVYGLETDAAGLGVYEAELAVEDSTRRNVAQRLLRGAREILGQGTAETRVRWQRQVEVVDDVVPEYLTVEVPRLPAGEYVVRVSLRDAASGREAESTRRIHVREVPEEGG